MRSTSAATRTHLCSPTGSALVPAKFWRTVIVTIWIGLVGIGCTAKQSNPDRILDSKDGIELERRLPASLGQDRNYGPLVLRTPTGMVNVWREKIQVKDAEWLLRGATSRATQVLLRVSMDYQDLHDGAAPVTIGDLVGSSFLWPGFSPAGAEAGRMLEYQSPSTLSRVATPLHDALLDVPAISLRFSGSTLTTITPRVTSTGIIEYSEQDFQLPSSISPLLERPSHLMRRAVTEESLSGLAPKSRWSRLNSTLAGWATEPDARIGIAARQLEWLLLQAGITLWRLPVDLEEAQAAAGVQLINLIPGQPNQADIEIAWDGQQAFLFTQRFASGVETESVLFFHGLGGSETSASWNRPEKLWEKAPQREWQPFAALNLVAGINAVIPARES